MFKRLATALLLRRVSRDLTALVTTLDRQTVLLARLADRYAPLDAPAPDRATLTAATGVSYIDPIDAELAEAYSLRTQRDTGHRPDDEEVAIYLADERTTDLHQRLLA